MDEKQNVNQYQALTDNKDFIKLLEIMNQGGEVNQANLFMGLATQIDALSKEVRALSQIVGERTGKAQKPEEAPAVDVRTVEETHNDVRKTFLDGVKNAVTHIKEFGVKGVSNCFDLLHIRNGLDHICKFGSKALERQSQSIDKIEGNSEKLHEATMHFKNAGRTISGKELLTEASESGKIAGTMTKFVDGRTKVTKAMMNCAESAISFVDKMKNHADVSASVETNTEANSKQTVDTAAGEKDPSAANKKLARLAMMDYGMGL